MRTLHESIVPELIGSIVSFACVPGGVLPNEIELARSRGVSRTAASEVIQKLAAPGLVEVERL
ncbi:GntR family transcriptional regulator [Paraburkholderia dinghuensis]|uniref:GntR family transcriptional regulator n=1 Tax=Paraburkholderia dinghuensis TaxID=2305225 RepID=A0A3N6PWW2_9BURK|nr:GntR family transcriptional regulator [Paraburkholderia dinghuensis]RQH04426.1 GntR family transcriptional regulator [Paraburkholderia dinghuensis]